MCACHPCAGGHANLLCIVPILTDDPRRESKVGIRYLAAADLAGEASGAPCLVASTAQPQKRNPISSIIITITNYTKILLLIIIIIITIIIIIIII